MSDSNRSVYNLINGSFDNDQFDVSFQPDQNLPVPWAEPGFGAIPRLRVIRTPIIAAVDSTTGGNTEDRPVPLPRSVHPLAQDQAVDLPPFRPLRIPHHAPQPFRAMALPAVETSPSGSRDRTDSEDSRDSTDSSTESWWSRDGRRRRWRRLGGWWLWCTMVVIAVLGLAAVVVGAFFLSNSEKKSKSYHVKYSPGHK